MINFLEFLFIHCFLIFKFGFIAIWEYHCTYIFSSLDEEKEMKITSLQEQSLSEATYLVEPLEVYTEPLVYESSILTEEQTNFFESLFSDLSITEEQNDSGSSVKEDDEVDELLSMECWESETPSVEISTKFNEGVSAKINDFVMTEQVWTVQVIGEEQGYIHVSDGTARAWIDATQFDSFGKGDILSVLVNRISEVCVELLNAEILQSYSSEFGMDYSDLSDEYISDDRIGA